jgi:hypothetical protein
MMENGLIEHQMQSQPNRRLPWHMPDVQRLVVNIDTGGEPKPGSAADGPGAFDRTVGGQVD